MKYKTQINTNIPKITYKSAKKIILYGVRQRVGNERTPWSFISILMMNVLEEVAPNYIIQLPQGNKERQIHSLGLLMIDATTCIQ